MSVTAVRRWLPVFLAGTIGSALLSGCGADEAPVPLTGLVLASASLPADYQVLGATVEDLVSANQQTLKQAETVDFEPAQCTPTADADFNPRLDPDNTAVLVAESDTATLSEVVTTVRRDIDADRRATTGPCRVVTAVPAKGTLAGARIVTTSTELPAPTGAAVQQALVLRSDSVTALAGQEDQFRVRSALLATVLVRRAEGEIVTVMLNVGSNDGTVKPAVPDRIEAPMNQDEYLKLVDEAVARAAR